MVCLICGRLLCMYHDYYHDGSRIDEPDTCDNPAEGPLKRHTSICGGSIGVFFILHDVTVMVLHNGQVNFNWGSIYLDCYNEEDYKIRRGKPLYLSKERFEYLQQIWASGSGPMDISHQ